MAVDTTHVIGIAVLHNRHFIGLKAHALVGHHTVVESYQQL